MPENTRQEEIKNFLLNSNNIQISKTMVHEILNQLRIDYINSCLRASSAIKEFVTLVVNRWPELRLEYPQVINYLAEN